MGATLTTECDAWYELGVYGGEGLYMPFCESRVAILNDVLRNGTLFVCDSNSGYGTEAGFLSHQTAKSKCFDDVNVLNEAAGTTFECHPKSQQITGCNSTNLLAFELFFSPHRKDDTDLLFFSVTAGLLVFAFLVWFCAFQACFRENKRFKGPSLTVKFCYAFIFVIYGFDMLSDWGFYYISVTTGYFPVKYEHDGGDIEMFSNISLAFCIIGTIQCVWCGWMHTLEAAFAGSEAGQKAKAASGCWDYIPFSILALETVPQLSLQIVYLITVGPEYSTVAVVSTIISIISFVINVMLAYSACKRKPAV